MRTRLHGLLAPVWAHPRSPPGRRGGGRARRAGPRPDARSRALAAVLAEVRAYAEERTLLFYCLRQTPEVKTILYLSLQGDIDDGVKKLRAAGSEPGQNAVLIESVLTHIRFAAPDAKDPALDPKCAGRDFVQEINFLKDAGTPLVMRPAFRALAPP